MNPIVYAIPVFLATILIEAWTARRRQLPAYDTADAITSLHFGVLSQVAVAFTFIFSFGYYVLIYQNLRLFSLPRDSVWVWLFTVLAYDFCYYWVHRCGHEVNLLWAAHQVHHSSEYYNLTTALRQTATGAFTAWPFYVLLAVIGVPPFVFATVALIDLLYQYWVHTELVPRLGWIDRVFVTPSNHRVHHGQNDYCIDRNYGGILVLWDRLFGTFAAERRNEPVIYGIRTPVASFNAAWGNAAGYREIWRKARTADSWLAALRTWFDPPAGRGQHQPAFDKVAFRRFDRNTQLTTRRYAIAQYALLVLPTSHFIAIAAQLGIMPRIAYALVIVAWVLSIGWLLEERRFALRLEMLRVLALGAGFVLAPGWFGWVAAPPLKIAIAAVLLLGAGWLWSRHARVPITT